MSKFGINPYLWKFKCPSCGQVQSQKTFLDMGLPLSQVRNYLGYTCIGWFKQTQPKAKVVGFCDVSLGDGCTYRGGIGRNISPVQLIISTTPPEERPTFAFH